MEPIGRRQFLTGTAMLGARALLSWHEAEAQMSTAKPHRIDVHHHHTPPPYLAAITARNIPGPVRDWTPEKSIADMDRAGVATATVGCAGAAVVAATRGGVASSTGKARGATTLVWLALGEAVGVFTGLGLRR